MSNKAQKSFDQMAKANHIGLRYVPSDPKLRKLLARAKVYARSAWRFDTTQLGTPPTHVYMVSGDGLNGYAYGEPEFDFIAFTTGTATVVQSTFGRMLQCSNVYPDYGDSSSEVGSERTSTLVLKASLLPNADPLPRDVNRRRLVEMLTMTFYDILIAHEIGHLRSGQFARDKTMGRGLCFAEMGERRNLNKAKLISSQAFEMNADSYAVNQGLLNLFAALAKAENHMSAQRFIAFRQENFQCWLFAAATMFALFQQGPLDLARLDASTHPPGCLRFKWAVNIAKRMAANGTIPLCVGEVDTIAGYVMGSLVVAIAAITHSNDFSINMEMTNDPAVERHEEKTPSKVGRHVSAAKGLEFR